MGSRDSEMMESTSLTVEEDQRYRLTLGLQVAQCRYYLETSGGANVGTLYRHGAPLNPSCHFIFQFMFHFIFNLMFHWGPNPKPYRHGAPGLGL